ncbi:MAG: hypothetical protein V4565_08435 [Bacteroidota bacterium]
METSIKSNQTSCAIRTEKSTANTNEAKNSITAFWSKMEFNRFGIISMLVVFIGCLGGAAAAYGAQDDTIKLALIAFPTIISLALVLAVAPMRVILYLSGVAVLLDLIILIF